jgi:hypothetical protein
MQKVGANQSFDWPLIQIQYSTDSIRRRSLTGGMATSDCWALARGAQRLLYLPDITLLPQFPNQYSEGE